jgi:UDP-sugar transporter A1/2/3
MIKQLIDEPIIIGKLMVPSILYTLQNNLQYVAISNLNPAVFQVLYQMKLLTTAAISLAMLNKHLSSRQWASLGLLVGGISLVQLSQQNPTMTGQESNIIGLTSVLLACCTSGFAGVYFEKVLKSGKVSLWVRNVQLALLGCTMAVTAVYSYDSAVVLQKGFFHGYTPLVWFVIALQAIGGLIVAVVVKYADNVMKGVATSLSIVISAIVSLFFPQMKFELSVQFIIGAVLVIFAVSAYSSSSQTHKKLTDIPQVAAVQVTQYQEIEDGRDCSDSGSS